MARRNQRFVRPAPRTMIWIGAGLTRTAVAASSAVLLGVLNAAALALAPFTIMRSRLTLHYETDQTAATERPQGAFGIVVVKEQATTAGIASLPTPVTEPNAEWFVYQGMIAPFIFGDATGFSPVGTQYEIDSKAARKVGVNEQIAVIAENRVAVGSDVTMEGRFLLKLH